MRRVSWAADFFGDLRYAVRSLRRTPGLTASVVLTLAVGIGMTTTPFSMVDALIFRPYPVPRSNDVVTLVSTSRDNSFDAFSYREYLDLKDHTRSYDGVIASGGARTVGFGADPRATPKAEGGMLVSGNFFSALGVVPQAGRTFRADEDEVPGRDAVVVLGPEFWKHEFGSDRSVVGRTIRLNGTDFTVIGVAPEDFTGLHIFWRPDVYVPLAMARLFSTNPQKNFFEDRDDRELTVRARLKAGTTLAQAQSELTGIAQVFARDYPVLNRDRGATVHTQLQMRTRADDLNWKFGVIFTILALAVLLVACTNVAGLLLSRASTRTREIAVRLALGSGRFRLVRLLLTESLILAVLGGVGGVAVGYAGLSFIQRFSIPAELPLKPPFQMDGRLLLASLVVALACAFLCGLAPALQSTRADLVTGLKTGGGESGRKRFWGRNLLVVAQVATSMMLLAASFLVARSFRNLTVGGLGYPTENLLMVRFDPRLVQYDATQTQHFYEQLLARVREAPGVQSAGLTQNPPLGLGKFDMLAFVPDPYEMPKDRESFTAAMDAVDEGFFETMGIPVVRGRGFRASDAADQPRVAVVNQQFVERYWPGGEAVGKRIRLDRQGGTPVEIVGITPTVKYRATGERPTEFVYLPLAQHREARMILLVRTSADPLETVAPVREIVRALEPNLPLLETRTYDDLYRYHVVEGPGVAIRMAMIMGGVALLLAMVGLYGLVAYTVSRRTREIGIRMALGAGPASAFRLVMRQGLVLVGMGSAAGLVLAFAIERLIQATLFDAGGVDLLVYLVVVPVVVLVTLLAAYLPARRASRIAPTLALRSD